MPQEYLYVMHLLVDETELTMNMYKFEGNPYIDILIQGNNEVLVLYERLKGVFNKVIPGIVHPNPTDNFVRMTYRELTALYLIDIMRAHGFGVKQIVK